MKSISDRSLWRLLAPPLLLAVFVSYFVAGQTPPAPSQNATPGNAQKGKDAFAMHMCATCHGAPGVKISEIKSKVNDSESIGLRPMEIEASLSGDYLQLVRFINALERDQLFFIIDSVELGGEQGGVVKLQMKMQTFLKANA